MNTHISLPLAIIVVPALDQVPPTELATTYVKPSFPTKGFEVSEHVSALFVSVPTAPTTSITQVSIICVTTKA